MTGGDALTAHPELGCNSPAVVEAEYIEIIRDAIARHPRSQQKAIGPSEVGIPCTRALLHKLNHDPEPPDDPWLPTIGTAVHTWLADTFEAYNASLGHGPDDPARRYIVEQRVSVGEICGVEITGSADLFDQYSGTVGDHKIIGETPIKEYRRKGPRPEYRAQFHLYGRGFARAGYKVNTVMMFGLPRNNVSLNARYVWSEPYDEAVAVAALDRCTALTELTAAVGIDMAVSMYPACGDTRYCPWCKEPWAPKPIDPTNPFGSR